MQIYLYLITQWVYWSIRVVGDCTYYQFDTRNKFLRDHSDIVYFNQRNQNIFEYAAVNGWIQYWIVETLLQSPFVETDLWREK